MSEKKGLELLAEMSEGCFIPPSAIANRLTASERAVIEAAKAWREAERNYEASGDGDDYIHFTEAYAALRAAVDELKG